MTAADLIALRALHGELALRFGQRARDPATPLAELRELQERLRLLDAALADPQAGARARRRATGIALLAVAALVSLAASIPMPSVPFSIEAEAGALRMRLAAAGELGPQAIAGPLAVDGYTALESPDAALAARGPGTGRGKLTIEAATLNLRRIVYPASATLDIAAAAQGSNLTLHAPADAIGVDIEFAGPTRIRVGRGADSAPQHSEPAFAEWVRLRAAAPAGTGQAPPPLTVGLGRGPQGGELAWTTLRPIEVRFVERGLASGSNEPAIVSSLRSARIRLLASSSEVTLAAGDELDLAGLELERCELVLGPVLRLKMSGSARRLSTRSGGFERSLKPSLLEHAARHQRVELFWSAGLILWGLMRGLQRLAAGTEP